MTQPLYSNAGFVQMLEIRKGSTFNIQLNIEEEDGTAMDLTGYTARASVAPKTPGAPAVNFVFNTPAGPLEFLTGVLSTTKTDQLVAGDRRMAVPTYHWTCDVIAPNGDVIPYCYGDVVVRASAIPA